MPSVSLRGMRAQNRTGAPSTAEVVWGDHGSLGRSRWFGESKVPPGSPQSNSGQIPRIGGLFCLKIPCYEIEGDTGEKYIYAFIFFILFPLVNCSWITIRICFRINLPFCLFVKNNLSAFLTLRTPSIGTIVKILSIWSSEMCKELLSITDSLKHCMGSVKHLLCLCKQNNGSLIYK